MTQTITALFESRADAIAAVHELIDAGIPGNSIQTTPEQDAGDPLVGRNYDTTRDEKGFWASLKVLFMPDDDRSVYAEAMHRGSILVAATVDDEQAARAEDILEQRGTVNLDQHEAAWRKEGWTGVPTVEQGKKTVAAAAVGAGNVASTVGDDKLQIVEERLQVGKRQVNSGRVKVRSYVVQTPVSEKINLRSENVQVNQVAADRALKPGEDPFKEQTIEATATSEEAVVAKQARVTGEVRVTKTANDRVETIQDTVRSTKVDVDDGRIVADQRATDPADKLRPKP